MEPDDVLAHYGIKGMKWGRRRPVGPDGRVVRGAKKLAAKQRAKRKGSEDYESTKPLRKKKAHQLTNSELQSLNKRLQLERSYNDLTSNAGQMKKGTKAAKDALEVLNTVNQVYAAANSPVGKAARSAVASSLSDTRVAKEYSNQKTIRRMEKAEKYARKTDPWKKKD